MPRTHRIIGWLIAAGLTVPPAVCNDYYVDALTGSNANSGADPGDAWLTLSFALTQVPANQPSNVFVAGGIYDSALGEAFPIHIGNRVRVIGEGDSVTVFVAGGATAFLIDDANGPVSMDTGLTGVRIEQSSTGVHVGSRFDPVACTLTGLTIESATIAGVFLTTDPGPSGQLDVVISTVDTLNCQTGLSVVTSFLSQGIFNLFVTVHCSDSRFMSSMVHGCSFCLSDPDTIMTGVFDRTAVVGSGGDAVHVETFEVGGVFLRANDSIFAGSGEDGLDDVFGVSTFQLWRSTIASNVQTGIDARGQLAVLQDSIVYGNGDDLGPGTLPLSASYDNIGDGDLAGTNGNISVDPLFRDTALGDFTPGYGTECIDGGSPAAAGLTDFYSRPRRTDGDLDLTRAADMGAIELPTLTVTGDPSVGGSVDLILQGDAGGFGLVLLARGPPAQSPISSPFGELFLSPGAATRFALVTTDGPPGVALRFSIPNDPALIGVTASFQALNRSTRSATGGAWTDVTSLTIVE